MKTKLSLTLILMCCLAFSGCTAAVGINDALKPEAAAEDAVGKLADGLMAGITKAGAQRLAVMDPLDPEGNLSQLSLFISDQLSARLSQKPGVAQIMERRRLNEIILQQQLELSAQFDPATVVPLGHKAGVDALIMGRIWNLGSGVVLASFKVISVETGRIVGASQARIADANFAAMMQRPLKADLTVVLEPAADGAALMLDSREEGAVGGRAVFRGANQGSRILTITAPGYKTINRGLYLSGNTTLRIPLVRDKNQHLPVAASDRAAPLRVRVWTDKNVYRVGDSLKVHFQANRDCYLYLYHQAAGGRLSLIFPNRLGRMNMVDGGRTYTVPGPEHAFDLVVTPPPGVEKIMALATTEPEKAASWEAVGVRGLAVKALKQRADATYTVAP